MKARIIENINQPEQLENLYRDDKKAFETAFYEVLPEIESFPATAFWKSRFDYENKGEGESRILKKDILNLILVCIITGFLIKLPDWFNLSLKDEAFYERNAGLIVLFGLSLYAFISRGMAKIKPILISVTIFALSALYVNILPGGSESHSVTLVFIHLPLMLWCLYGLVFIQFDMNDFTKRISYVKYNGDLAILGAIILISGGILTGITIGLFSAIGMNIEKFYFEYIVLIGLVSSPIVATYIIRTYPFIANKIAPVIASIFSPLVLITLIVYLISIVITGKDPYNDRDFLILFNLMLLGVMGIVVFSVSEISADKKQRFSELVLFALALVSLVVDMVALSAIVYRLGEYGFTPNRTAVLGSNLLIFVNLVFIAIDLYKVNFKNQDIKLVESTLARYLPVYTVWTVFVVFVLPWIFGLK
jgi:hypothetical protein